MFIRTFTAWLGLFLCTGASADPTAAAGKIAGRVLDAEGQPVAHAMVILCDQRTGIPVEATGFLPFTEVGRDPANIAHCVTDQAGAFAFPAISRPATYRVFAQSWPAAAEPPTDPMAVMGEVVQLHGVASDLDPSSPAGLAVELRPLGRGSLSFDQKFGNDETLLLISTAPPIADTVLGFHAWGADHLSHLLGYHRMVRGRTTILGLPDGEMHFSVFSADNNPGFGQLSVDAAARAGAGETGPVAASIVAGWSDARRTPPARLQTLCDDIDAGRVDPATALGLRPEDKAELKGLTAALARCGPLDREITLPDGRKTTVGDIIACEGYLHLQKAAKKR
jgi:hypothetical protein